MGEVTPRLFIFGFIIFTLLIMGGITIMSELANKNADFVNNEKFASFNRTFNRYNELIASGEELKASVEDSQPEKSLFGVLDSLINAAWGSIKSFFSTFSFMSDAFGGLTSVFGVPYWVSALITTLIIVMFAFSIYSLIFQGKT
jgi:hypothetical protein